MLCVFQHIYGPFKGKLCFDKNLQKTSPWLGLNPNFFHVTLDGQSDSVLPYVKG